MIDEVFGPAGFLSEKFAGYAPRKGQLDMARMVEQAIAEKKHLIAEGPTGTGKSLAYLVPAIAHACSDPEQPKRIIVVTANIALQEQLVQKDLPLLAEVLPFPFRFALMKGKNNYLCIDSLGKALAENVLLRADRDGKQLRQLIEWAQETETGDVSEFPETPTPANWRRLSTTSDECKGSSCRHYADCFAELARREALNAHVIVTNYHMFFAHLVVREKMRELQERGAPVELDIVLPPSDIIILDEAHKGADIARDFLGFQISKGQVEWLVRGFQHELAEETRAAGARYFAAASDFKRSRSYRARLKKGHPLEGEDFAVLLGRTAKFYKDAVGAGAWSPDEKAELEVRARKGALLAAQVRQVARPEDHPEEVFFIEENERATVVKSKPIDVGPWLRHALFKSFRTVVLTSATLATGATSGFGFVKKELGLDDALEIVAESPFSWNEKVLLVIPKTMCMADDREAFPSFVADHFARVCENAGGRTLGLFTSYKNLQAAYDRYLPDAKVTVLKQGEAPRTRLVARFREDVTSVLLGVESFWAGVDVPGESLSCVVIDRLPFPTPDDPIVDAISERDDKWFFNYAIPRAIIQFKQGFGRLIRTTTDRGCVVLLDRRVMEKGYGRSFLNALPKTFMSDDVDDVKLFLEQA